MQIGDLAVDVPVLLAPMAAVTDLPFRTVCEEFGVGLTITEFLSAHALAVGDPKTCGKLTASLDGRRFGVQIFGREPAAMDAAARMAVSIGASLVDINMGCPAKRVIAGACGSALMREPELAGDLVRAVVAAVPAEVPVIGNGDVVDVPGYLRMRGETGCDGVMIGRGAMGNPWLFRR